MKRTAPRRIVIVGGGFGGLHLVRKLERKLRPGEAEITLVDRNNYHLFTPLAYQVATGELPSHAVAYPLRATTSRAGIRFLQSEVQALELDRRVVRTADGELRYDHLVVACGTVSNDYGISGVKEHTLPMKSLADALAVKRSILESFERAAVERDPARRRTLLTFVLIGAGPVGVELASSLRDLMDHTLRPMYPDLDLRRETSIVLLDGSERVIPGMDKRLSAIASRRLGQQRVRVILRTLVSEVRPGVVLTKDGARFEARTIVWAGGVRANPLLAALDVEHSKDGRLVVDPMFRVGGRADVLALGDAAALDDGGRPLPQLAQVAVLQAPALARNLVHLLRDEPLVPYVHQPKGDLVALGRTDAAAQLRRMFGVAVGDHVFGGLLAWSVWRVNYLTQLLGVRNRATLILEWILSFFFSRMAANTP